MGGQSLVIDICKIYGEECAQMTRCWKRHWAVGGVGPHAFYDGEGKTEDADRGGCG